MTLRTIPSLDSQIHLLIDQHACNRAIIVIMHGLASAVCSPVLSVKVCELIEPGVQWALVSSYSVDIRSLLKAAPCLRRARQVVIAHGEKFPLRCDA